MLRIKIEEIFRHRNETTFRPYLWAKHLFREIGIEFIFEGNNYDLSWVGQASYSDKNHPYERSISRGLWFLDKIEGDYVLFDGNDSASLMGTYDVFKESGAKLLLKNSLYKNREWYELPFIHGRAYWETSVMDMDKEYAIDSPDFSKIQLSGTNWLSTVTPNWLNYKGAEKDIDVCALFAYPAKENKEFLIPTNKFYDDHREKCINWLKKLPSNIKVVMLEEGQRLPITEYYKTMSRSKLVIAPFGYGEIAPRDIESAMVGSILIKPDMSHLETIPNVYVSQMTYSSVKWDFSNLNSEIEILLEKFNQLQEFYVENMRKKFIENYNSENLVIHTHKWISELEGFGTV